MGEHCGVATHPITGSLKNSCVRSLETVASDTETLKTAFYFQRRSMPVSQFSRRLRVTGKENNFSSRALCFEMARAPILRYVRTAAVKLFRSNVVPQLSILLLCTL